MSVITELELRYGVSAELGNAVRLGQLTHLLSNWTPWPVDRVVAAAFNSVVDAAITAGQTPRRRMNDLVIAATALAHEMTLVTNDGDLSSAVGGLVPVQALY